MLQSGDFGHLTDNLDRRQKMSPTALRIIIALVLFTHGVGHIMALLPAFKIASTETWHARSWLLNRFIGESASRVILVILFGAALLGFVAAALGLMGWLVPHDAWRILSIWSAAISLIAVLLYWNAFVALFPNKLGALAVNIAVLVCLLFLNWPSEADIGY
jgi:hypothetical protein